MVDPRHLIELPKYDPPGDNRVIRDPIEQWLYFFRLAEPSTREQLLRRLPDPVFDEATGVLEMIARNPEQRQLYNERLKMERDQRARLLQAHEEGWLIGRIQLLQELTGQAPQSADELARLGIDELTALQQRLQGRLRDRD